MSFLNTIRGFGRSSKKTKNNGDGQPLYSHPNSSDSPLRRTQSPTKSIPIKQQRNNQVSFPNPESPSKRSRSGQPSSHHQSRSPRRSGRHTHQSNYSSNSINNNGNNDHELPLFLCEPFIKTALVKGSFKTIVQPPKYVDYGEWLALNIFELFNNLNQFYGVISDYVTPEAYPTMNAGPHTNYLWVDGNGQTVNLPACQYIEYVITWISNKINDQSVFPTKTGGVFPPNFMKDCKNISRQMFRIFAHLYHNHFDKIVHLSLEAHFNSFFAHFICLVKEYNLMDRSELEPLLPLIENFEQQGKII
ncbi:Mob1/phocein [Scheffersomyces xylosifermentans]|uniref:Mob1/phocein n=1 Tax=Scheffersomyces xylosifermentans TaxID=1304137 RepID=UPI00315C51A3